MVSILTCTCGVTEYNSFLVKITKEGDKIVWSNFLSYQEGWDMVKLAPFEFDKVQYLTEIKKIDCIAK